MSAGPAALLATLCGSNAAARNTACENIKPLCGGNTLSSTTCSAGTTKAGQSIKSLCCSPTDEQASNNLFTLNPSASVTQLNTQLTNVQSAIPKVNTFSTNVATTMLNLNTQSTTLTNDINILTTQTNTLNNDIKTLTTQINTRGISTSLKKQKTTLKNSKQTELNTKTTLKNSKQTDFNKISNELSLTRTLKTNIELKKNELNSLVIQLQTEINKKSKPTTTTEKKVNDETLYTESEILDLDTTNYVPSEEAKLQLNSYFDKHKDGGGCVCLAVASQKVNIYFAPSAFAEIGTVNLGSQRLPDAVGADIGIKRKEYDRQTQFTSWNPSTNEFSEDLKIAGYSDEQSYSALYQLTEEKSPVESVLMEPSCSSTLECKTKCITALKQPLRGLSYSLFRIALSHYLVNQAHVSNGNNEGSALVIFRPAGKKLTGICYGGEGPKPLA